MSGGGPVRIGSGATRGDGVCEQVGQQGAAVDSWRQVQIACSVLQGMWHQPNAMCASWDRMHSPAWVQQTLAALRLTASVHAHDVAGAGLSRRLAQQALHIWPALLHLEGGIAQAHGALVLLRGGKGGGAAARVFVLS